MATIAAAATLTGCLDPDYVRPTDRNKKPAVVSQPAPCATERPEAEEPSCRCAPGTKHVEKCMCGAPDCKCEIVPQIKIEPVEAPPQSKTAPEQAEPVQQPQQPAAPAAAGQETTTYYVQRGDSLSKISKKFNVTIAAIHKANPKIKGEKILVGQKLAIPGKHDAGAAAEKPAMAAPVAKPAKPAAKFTGETKEYTVKNGDTLGAIALSSGITVAQLKELNALENDSIRVGKKLKVPAVKQTHAAPADTKQAKTAPKNGKAAAADKAKSEGAKPEAAKTKPASAAETTKPEPAAPVPVPHAVEDAAAEPAAPAAGGAQKAKDAVEYVVKEGEDIIGISLKFQMTPIAIRDLNNMAADEEVKEGQKILLPAGTKID